MAVSAAASSLNVLPKSETGALEYLLAHPTHDGRGVTVAVLDTGVDPRAAGLERTSDGRPKMSELYDCTGSGDVDTKTVVIASVNESEKFAVVVSPLTGRSLKVRSDLSADQRFRVGSFPVRSLYPQPLVPRVKQDRLKSFEVKQKALVQNIRAKLAQPLDDEARKDLEAELEIAQELESKEKDTDHGAIGDALVFTDHNGNFRVLLNLDEVESVDGIVDLRDQTAIAEYKVAQETAFFGEESNLTYSVNVHDGGSVLEVVTVAGSHGTHVASIVACNFGINDSRNGVAPGAQIISMKIGDTRLGTMETGMGFVRAIMQCIRSHVDVINLSYGELSTNVESGRVHDLLVEAQRQGITIVCSAGNEGPALGSVGAPGGVMRSCIGVGAIMSASMARDQHSLRPGASMTPYSWSSRGPAPDGHVGVSICAPGAAITSVPLYNDSQMQLMNGTSMASPNVAGAVAIIISALKAHGLTWSPQLIQRALEGSAQRFRHGSDAEDALSQGQGMIQVGAAVELAIALSRAEYSLVHFETLLASGARGVYLRNGAESELPMEETVFIKPVWAERATSAQKSSFERRFQLLSTQPSWLSVPDVLVLHNAERSVRIAVDPSKLPRGEVHYAELQAVEIARPELGVAFRVPVTVIRPLEVVKEGNYKHFSTGMTLTPGKVVRRFFQIPALAGLWASITFKAKAVLPRRQFCIATLQRVKEHNIRRTSLDEYFWLQDGDAATFRIDLFPQATLEVALAQYTTQIGDNGSVDMEFELHGLQAAYLPSASLTPVSTAVNSIVHSGSDVVTLQCMSTLTDERVLPQGYYTMLIRRINPTTSVTNAVTSSRDLHDPSWKTQNFVETVNTYALNIAEKDATVVLRVNPLDPLLYESPFELQMVHVFDENKERVSVTDYKTGSFSLSKGKYLVRLHLRHPATESVQNAMKNIPITLEKPLSKDKQVPVSLHNTVSDAILGAGKLSSTAKPRAWRCNIAHSIVLAPPMEAKVPKEAEAGDILYGYLLLRAPFEDESIPSAVAKMGLKPPVGSFALSYVIPNKERESTKEKEKASDRLTRELLAGAVGVDNALAAWQRQSDTELIAALVKNNRHADADILLPQFLSRHPGHLPLLKTAVEYRLKQLQSPLTPVAVSSMEYAGRLRELLKSCDSLSEEKEADKKGERLFALLTKVGALGDYFLETIGQSVSEVDSKEFQEQMNKTLESIKALNKSLDDIRVFRAQIAEEILKKKTANAFKVLRKALATGNATSVQEKALRELQVMLLKRLGGDWAHWARLLERRQSTQYPKGLSIL